MEITEDGEAMPDHASLHRLAIEFAVGVSGLPPGMGDVGEYDGLVEAALAQMDERVCAPSPASIAFSPMAPNMCFDLDRGERPPW